MAYTLRRRRVFGSSQPRDMTPAGQLIYRMNTKPDATREALIRQFYTDLGPTILSKIFVLYMAGATQQAAQLSWVTPAYDMQVLHGTIDYVADRGFKGDGSTFYGETGFVVPPANQNSFHFFGVTQTAGTGVVGGAFGLSGTTGSFDIRPNSSGTNGTNWRNCNTTTQTLTATVGNGVHWDSSRLSNSGYQRYRNGAPQGGVTGGASVTPTIVPLFFGAGNQETTPGVPNAPTLARLSAWGCSSGLTDTEVATFYTARHNYLHAIGAE